MKNIIILLLIGFLTNCTSLRYGNFTQASHGVFELMAKDTAAQLGHVYPPAKNRLCLSQKVSDPFGMRLIELLRKQGFGVMEKANSSREANFFYVVDEPIPRSLYRVSVFVGEQSLSRAYSLQHGVLAPVSSWSHKE